MARGGTVLAGGATGAAVGTLIAPGIGTIIGSVIGAALTRTSVGGAERLVLALSVRNGWTFFGVVDQDYRVPDEILSRLGWDTVDLERANLEAADVENVALDKVDLDATEVEHAVTYLHRGVIGVRRIGYI